MTSLRKLIIFIVITTAIYVLLAILAHHAGPFFLDLSTTKFIQSFRTNTLDWVMRDISWPGYYPQFLTMTEIVIAGLLILRLWKETIFMIISLVGVATGSLTKIVVDRPRPPDSLVWVNDHLENGGYSFPAGHVYTYVVIFGWLIIAIYFLLPKESLIRKILLIINIAIIILIGVARVYLGDHWLSDVIASYLLGLIWLTTGFLLYKLFNERLLKNPGFKYAKK